MGDEVDPPTPNVRLPNLGDEEEGKEDIDILRNIVQALVATG